MSKITNELIADDHNLIFSDIIQFKVNGHCRKEFDA